MRLLFDLELMTKFRFPRGRKVFGITWSFNDYKGEWNVMFVDLQTGKQFKTYKNVVVIPV